MGSSNGQDYKRVTPAGYQYLTVKHDPEKWARAFFKTDSSCEAVENNMSECFNAAILESRFKPIVDMLEDIRLYVIDRMQNKRIAANRWVDLICPEIRKKLEDHKDKQRFWTPYPCGLGLYEVKHGNDGFVMNLEGKTCACRMWQLSGIPCPHAVSAIYHERRHPEEYVSEWLKKPTYSKAYQYFLKPINGRLLWPKTGATPLLPPIPRKMPGRPKTKRRKSATEVSKSTVSGHRKIRRFGEVKRCTRCKDPSHNVSRCPLPPPERAQSVGSNVSNAASAPKKRGRPRKTPLQENTNVPSAPKKRGRPRKERVPVSWGLFTNIQSGNPSHVYYDNHISREELASRTGGTLVEDPPMITPQASIVNSTTPTIGTQASQNQVRSKATTAAGTPITTKASAPSSKTKEKNKSKGTTAANTKAKAVGLQTEGPSKINAGTPTITRVSKTLGVRMGVTTRAWAGKKN